MIYIPVTRHKIRDLKDVFLFCLFLEALKLILLFLFETRDNPLIYMIIIITATIYDNSETMILFITNNGMNFICSIVSLFNGNIAMNAKRMSMLAL